MINLSKASLDGRISISMVSIRRPFRKRGN
jgi:hypothetical protein